MLENEKIHIFLSKTHTFCATVRLTCYCSDTFLVLLVEELCVCICACAWLLDVSVQSRRKSERWSEKERGREGEREGQGVSEALTAVCYRASAKPVNGRQTHTHTHAHPHSHTRMPAQTLTRAKTCTNMFVLCICSGAVTVIDTAAPPVGKWLMASGFSSICKPLT